MILLDDEYPEYFPDPRASDANGLVALSESLSTERLVAAYRKGIFPWMKMEESPHFWCWFSPDPRMVLYPEEFKVSRSLAKALKDNRFEVRVNQAFDEVMRACAEVPRPEQESTWIEPDMMIEYSKLHSLGIAHSIEARLKGDLVGGLYGLAIGDLFFGESMFHLQPEASKACMAKLVELAQNEGLRFIDCQVPNPFLHSLGAREITREVFLDQVEESCKQIPSSVQWPEKALK